MTASQTLKSNRQITETLIFIMKVAVGLPVQRMLVCTSKTTTIRRELEDGVLPVEIHSGLKWILAESRRSLELLHKVLVI